MASRINGSIKSVAEDSLAWEAGLEEGDILLSINGHPVRDLLEYEYLCLEDDLVLEVLRGEETLQTEIERDDDEDLGIEFDEELFDGLHSCRNNCVFCFLQQMPKGMRKSLYVRDDDYRLSLAHGNYITLTNVSDDELDRICSQKMSPIYVSVQATNPETRSSLLRNPSAGRIMDQLRKLADSRITMHTQIVLCKGLNDGSQLDRTISDLSSLHPWVQSIGVVPVGLTKYRDNLTPLPRFDRESADAVIRQCTGWQRRLTESKDSRLVFPSDEFYLLSGRRLPGAGAYEGFPQLENGIGLTRVFLDDLSWVRRLKKHHRIAPGRYVLVTGALAAPIVGKLSETLNEVDGVSSRVSSIVNKFFGESVTVAGLLTGCDVLDAVSGVERDEEVLIPDVLLNDDRFLDDITIEELQSRCQARVTVVPTSPRGVVEALVR